MTSANPPRIDLANLLIEDPEQYDAKSLNSTSKIQEIVEKNYKLLLGELFKLPSSVVDDTIVVTLPPSTTLLPREKIIPAAKAPTKWETYAATKGITTRKKSKLIWDEVTQTWKPRFGYRRAENEKKRDWAVVAKANDDPMADPFAKKRNAKRENVAKNNVARMGNEMRGKRGPLNPKANLTKGATGANTMPLSTDRKAAPSGIGGIGMSTSHKSVDEISRQAFRARSSTASVGKFQDTFKGEKQPKNRGKKRNFLSNETKAADEKTNQLTVLRRALNREAAKKPKVDGERAANIHTAQTQKAAHIDKTMNEEHTSVRKQSRIANDKTLGNKKTFVGGFKQSSRTKRSQFFEAKQSTGRIKTKGLRGAGAKSEARRQSGAGNGKAGAKKGGKGKK